MQCYTFTFKTEQLPSNFQYHTAQNDDEYNLRANLENKHDVHSWIRQFGVATATQWNVKRTKTGPTRNFFEFVCHHSSFMKLPKDEHGCNKRGISKNASCLARVRIYLNVGRSKRSTDPFVKKGLWAKIRISKQHTHTLNTVETLRFLQDKDDTLRDTFFKYFSDNMTASEAKHFHECKLSLRNASEADFANGNINPTQQTATYWFSQWRMLNIGPRSGTELLSKLNEKKTLYAEKNIILEFKENPFCVMVSTPLMQRAHALPSSKELLFVDSTSACDSGHHSVTFLLTACAAGGVPLAVIITSGQTTEAYSEGFRLTNTIPGCFGNMGFPKIILTDNSAAEIAATKEIWPEATNLLCTFHVLQAVWRWLWDAGNGIKAKDRVTLMNSFKSILRSENLIEMETAYNKCVQTGIDLKYSKWIKYMDDYYKFKERWVLAYRDSTVRDYHNSNFSETSIQVFKNIVLSKVKAFNLISLVDFCVTSLEEYYVTKLKNFSLFKNQKSFSFFRSTLKKVSYLSEDDIICVDEKQLLFFVPSEKDRSLMYTVDCEVGSCSCNEGKYGKFCKHQCAVHQFFKMNLVNIQPISANDRYLMAKTALGSHAVPDTAVYDEFETTHPSTPVSSSDDERKELFHCIMHKFEDKLFKYPNSEGIIAGLEKYSKSIDNISTVGNLLFFLNATPKVASSKENSTLLDL